MNDGQDIMEGFERVTIEEFIEWLHTKSKAITEVEDEGRGYEYWYYRDILDTYFKERESV